MDQNLLKVNIKKLKLTDLKIKIILMYDHNLKILI